MSCGCCFCLSCFSHTCDSSSLIVDHHHHGSFIIIFYDSKCADDFEKNQKKLVAALKKKDQEASSQALEGMANALLTYRTVGRLLGPDGGGDVSCAGDCTDDDDYGHVVDDEDAMVGCSCSQRFLSFDRFRRRTKFVAPRVVCRVEPTRRRSKPVTSDSSPRW